MVHPRKYAGMETILYPANLQVCKRKAPVLSTFWGVDRNVPPLRRYAFISTQAEDEFITFINIHVYKFDVNGCVAQISIVMTFMRLMRKHKIILPAQHEMYKSSQLHSIKSGFHWNTQRYFSTITISYYTCYSTTRGPLVLLHPASGEEQWSWFLQACLEGPHRSSWSEPSRRR